MTIEQSISSVFGDVLNTIANNPKLQPTLTRLLADFPLQGQPRSSQTTSSQIPFGYNSDGSPKPLDIIPVDQIQAHIIRKLQPLINAGFNPTSASFPIEKDNDGYLININITLVKGKTSIKLVSDFIDVLIKVTVVSLDKVGYMDEKVIDFDLPFDMSDLDKALNATLELANKFLLSQTQTATSYALDAGNFHNPDYLLQFRNAVNAKLGRLEPFSTMGKPTGYGFIGNVENVFGNFVVFDLPQYKMGFGLMFPNSAFIVVRKFDYNTSTSGAKVFDKDFVNIQGSFKNIDNKGQPLDAGDFAEIIANYVEKYGQLEPTSPFQPNEMVWVVAKDGSLQPKVGIFKKYFYDQQTGTETVQLDFKSQNNDGSFYTYSKSFDYPSNIYDLYTDVEYQRLLAYNVIVTMSVKDLIDYIKNELNTLDRAGFINNVTVEKNQSSQISKFYIYYENTQNQLIQVISLYHNSSISIGLLIDGVNSEQTNMSLNRPVTLSNINQVCKKIVAYALQASTTATQPTTSLMDTIIFTRDKTLAPSDSQENRIEDYLDKKYNSDTLFVVGDKRIRLVVKPIDVPLQITFKMFYQKNNKDGIQSTIGTAPDKKTFVSPYSTAFSILDSATLRQVTTLIDEEIKWLKENNYISDATQSVRSTLSGTEGIVRSPYTLVFDKTYHSNPPPLSPLAGAYYGSKAYYDKGSNKEISIHVLGANVTKPPKCPQISGGSAKKWVVSNPYNATCVLIKQYSKKSQPRVETFVAQVHRALGMPAPDMRFHQTHLTSPLVSDAFQPLTSTKMSKIVKQQYSSTSPTINMNAFRNAVDLLIVSTWLVNWDVLGMTGDNSLIDDKGNIQCIDLGGALMFRATGGWKGVVFEKWNADWGADYQTIKTNMKLALIQMQTIGTNKQFAGLLAKGLGKDRTLEITEKMMMLFHPQYNYIEKLTVWTGLPTQVHSDGYTFEGVQNSGADDLNKMFVTWLQARALALYEIVREDHPNM